MSKKQYLLSIILLGFSLVLWRVPIAQTLSLALHEGQYTHILLIVPVAASLILFERKKIRSSAEASLRIASGALFAVALTIFLMTTLATISSDVQLTVFMVGLVIWWIASFLFCFGYSYFRGLLFPLCFLFWIVPWPQRFLDLLIGLLQQYSASTVGWMFQAVGIPVLRDGVLLSIPGLTIEVAKECSSIRSSLILLISSMVLAQLLLHTKWRKTIVILVAVPLSVAKNAVRIFTLSMLGVHVNRGFLTGRLHHEGGVVFYTGALGVIFLLISWLQRQEANSRSRKVMEAATR